ncbi:putative methyltransferase [Jejuia pallidilutea]|uniref:Putative methyltransferase n=1 Tax=Jejuia pallidilutea TaxID=504487 RepID=A0A362XEG7_9FLAO|nr:class I SAM-dependent methyltransferase [Jejuia pallidilutea]PQV50260.1 putative methyltransferase [Jejuia pallidilutea]
MNKHILNTEIQNFINYNINSDINVLVLKGTSFSNVKTSEIVEQIEAKKRCKTKLSTWFKTKNIYYPNKLNIEQTSSEITAKYKSELISGQSIIDITGGFGVDCFYFSKQFKRVVHCDINSELSAIVKYNYQQLKIDTIETHNTNGLDYLQQNDIHYDWIYVDPSRRHDSKGKVFFLGDCLPNIPKHLELLFSRSKNVMIKTSPLLDISAGINELEYVKTIHIIAVNNEVKELLWILEKGYSEHILIKTTNINTDKRECFSIQLENENYTAPYSKPLTYLYEPNAAILKSGAFQEVSKQLNVFKLHQHSHLYTNEQLVYFPGRIFIIENVVPYNKKEIKALGLKKANITTRNFPETVKNIRKKFKINDGGETYLFFTTDLNNNKIIIEAKKLKNVV